MQQKDCRLGGRGQYAHPGATSAGIQPCCVAGNSDLPELVHHSDRGSQYLSLVYTDRLGELGTAPSVGSRGDSYDNALAEAVNVADKTELINRANRGAASTTSSWPPLNGCSDTTKNACTKPSAMSHQPSTRQPSPAPHIQPVNPGPRNRIGTKPGVLHAESNPTVGDSRTHPHRLTDKLTPLGIAMLPTRNRKSGQHVGNIDAPDPSDRRRDVESDFSATL